MEDDAAADVHDVFSMLYAGDEWESDDDEVPKDKSTRADSQAKLLAALDALLTPSVPAKRRLFQQPPRTPTVFPSTCPLPPLPDASTYAPYSPLPLLARLRTFGLATSSLPPALNAHELALHGWTSAARESFACATCHASWGITGLGALSDRVRTGVISRLSATLSSRHAPGCGWRVRSSPPSLIHDLRRRLHPLSSSSLAPLARSLQSRSLSGPLEPSYTSPLTPGETATLVTSLTRHEQAAATTPPLGALPAALAFFGWYPYDPSFPSDHVSTTGTSTSTGTDTTSTPTEIVRCRVCARRVGLWHFADSARVFDLVNEHVGWCPLRDGSWRGAAILTTTSVDDALAAVLARPRRRFKRRRFSQS